MKAAKNRERILQTSIELFNQNGVVPVTTNHIAQNLQISPGNLYFHFRNKEEIVRELFDRMCDATYAIWRSLDETTSKTVFPKKPIELIEKSFEVFWDFRFFHREMYHLRRKDPQLAKRWKTHLQKTRRLLQATYIHWVKTGVTRKVTDPEEMQMISDVVLITSSSFLLFFESPDRPASRRSMKQGVHHIARLLLTYHNEPYKAQLVSYLRE
jgi:AcrR family transcriptional regulator